MAEALDLSVFVKRAGDLAHMELAVEGVGCAGCIRKIESGLKQLPGVVDARLNSGQPRVAVGDDRLGHALQEGQVVDRIAVEHGVDIRPVEVAAVEPLLDLAYLARVVRGRPDPPARELPVVHLGLDGQHVPDAELGSDRSGHEGVGTGHESELVAREPVALDQLPRLAAHVGAHVQVHELGVPGIQHGARKKRKQLHLELGVGLDVEGAGLVASLEVSDAITVRAGVEGSAAHDEPGPRVGAVDGQQGLVEVEERKSHWVDFTRLPAPIRGPAAP